MTGCDPSDKPSKILFWRLATLAVRLPSPQLGLTAVFGMRTGVTRAMKHQNKTFDKIFNFKASGSVAQLDVGRASAGRQSSVKPLSRMYPGVLLRERGRTAVNARETHIERPHSHFRMP